MPSLSNQHFDLYSAIHVPETHSWPPIHLHDHPIADSSSSIPVIDISDPDAASMIGAACRSWGAFYATSHGVPPDLLNLVESHARSLFSLPLHRKLLTARRDGSLSGYGHPPLSSFFPKLMWSEGFTLAGEPLGVASQLGPIIDSSSFCEVMKAYRKEMKKLAARLMRLMLLSLGLHEDEVAQVGPLKELSDAAEVIQLNSYPACPEPERAIGMAAHTDSALLTVLHQSDGACGLQVLRCGSGSESAQWVEVPHRPETLVVNVGDLFHILSNGRFKNVRHRALVSKANHRISAAYFMGPPGDLKVGSVEKVVDLGVGPIYRPVTWPEYLGIRTRLFDKALESLKFHEVGLEKD
ncbi:gibberellin 3-beta-dioxygenase 1-like [Phalaenopsis equestris]|uniref:gibberellin 3-beta-dioxygenase 1-like n=1 Tax=Phalaenopsis equestris TaxID=78828 RepID=UPI0009E34D89|nr:gibberellin 3-beta-dioxygenase 1-like [Phalaenopsis equestris]